MTLKRLFVSLGRRWYLTLAGVLITLGLCTAAYMNTEPTLERSASDLLVPGKTTIPLGGNPYLYLGGLGQLSDVLVSSLNSEQTIGGFQDQFPGTTIAIARDTSTSGPMIAVSVSGTDEAAVAGALKAVVAQIPQSLTQLQTSAGVPADARVSIITLTNDVKSTVINKSRFETIGLVGVAGLVVTILLVGLIDGLLLGRRQRAAATTPDPESGSETIPDETADAVDASSVEPRETDESLRPAKRSGRKRTRRAPETAPAPATGQPVPASNTGDSPAASAATPDDEEEQDIDWEYLLTQSSTPRAGREGSDR